MYDSSAATAIDGLSSLAAAVAAAAVAPPTPMPADSRRRRSHSGSSTPTPMPTPMAMVRSPLPPPSASRSRSPTPTHAADVPKVKVPTPTATPTTHSTARMIACRFRDDSCPKSFPNNYSRRSHEIEVHYSGRAPFPCPVPRCVTIGYTVKNSLLQHIRQKHPTFSLRDSRSNARIPPQSSSSSSASSSSVPSATTPTSASPSDRRLRKRSRADEYASASSRSAKRLRSTERDPKHQQPPAASIERLIACSHSSSDVEYLKLADKPTAAEVQQRVAAALMTHAGTAAAAQRDSSRAAKAKRHGNSRRRSRSPAAAKERASLERVLSASGEALRAHFGDANASSTSNRSLSGSFSKTYALNTTRAGAHRRSSISLPTPFDPRAVRLAGDFDDAAKGTPAYFAAMMRAYSTTPRSSSSVASSLPASSPTCSIATTSSSPRTPVSSHSALLSQSLSSSASSVHNHPHNMFAPTTSAAQAIAAAASAALEASKSAGIAKLSLPQWLGPRRDERESASASSSPSLFARAAAAIASNGDDRSGVGRPKSAPKSKSSPMEIDAAAADAVGEAESQPVAPLAAARQPPLSELDELRQQVAVLQDHNASLRLELTKIQCQLESAESGSGRFSSARRSSAAPRRSEIPRLERVLIGEDGGSRPAAGDSSSSSSSTPRRRSLSPKRESSLDSPEEADDLDTVSIRRLHRQYEGVISLLEARNRSLSARNAELGVEQERLRLYNNMLVVQESAKAGMVEAQRCTIEALMCLNASQAAKQEQAKAAE